jgi:hypothetical protein
LQFNLVHARSSVATISHRHRDACHEGIPEEWPARRHCAAKKLRTNAPVPPLRRLNESPNLLACIGAKRIHHAMQFEDEPQKLVLIHRNIVWHQLFCKAFP